MSPITFVDPERRAGDVHVYSLTGEPPTRRLALAWREPASRAGIEGSVLAHIDGLVSALHALTLPHSRISAPTGRRMAASSEKIATTSERRRSQAPVIVGHDQHNAPRAAICEGAENVGPDR